METRARRGIASIRLLYVLISAAGGILSADLAGAAEASAPVAIYQVEDLDHAPKALDQAPPRYPSSVEVGGISGVVDVAFVVDTQGNVVGARARKCTVSTKDLTVEFDRALRGTYPNSHKSAEAEPGYAVLRDSANKIASSAVRGVNLWTFKPGDKGGRAVNSVMAVELKLAGPRHAGTVSVQVTGLDPTTTTNHLTAVTNDEFAGIVGSAVASDGLFAGTAVPEQAKYLLDIEVLNQKDLASVSYTFTATLIAHWRLTRVSDQRVMWETDVTSTATSTRGEAQVAATLTSGGADGMSAVKQTNTRHLAASIATSQNTKQAAIKNVHDALKEVWDLKF